MAIVVIPTRTDLVEYRQQVRLEGVLFTLLVRLNARDDSWYIDLLDANEVTIRSGIRLRVQTRALRLIATAGRPAGEIMPVDATGADTEPDSQTIGVAVPVLYADAADVAAATS